MVSRMNDRSRLDFAQSLVTRNFNEKNGVGSLRRTIQGTESTRFASFIGASTFSITSDIIPSDIHSNEINVLADTADPCG